MKNVVWMFCARIAFRCVKDQNGLKHVFVYIVIKFYIYLVFSSIFFLLIDNKIIRLT